MVDRGVNQVAIKQVASSMERGQNYFEKLRDKMDVYVHLVYKVSGKFPKEELYGVTSQLRRSSLSVILNFIEGFARQRQNVKLNFWEIAYGSLKESKYLLSFVYKEGYILKDEYQNLSESAEEIGAMLWSALKSGVEKV